MEMMIGRKKRTFLNVVLCAALLAAAISLLTIDKSVVNRSTLFDMAGQPYGMFLKWMNLPRAVGAIFVVEIGGRPDRTERADLYGETCPGDVFTYQLISFLSGVEITEYLIASYINLIFGVFVILFSFLVGHFIFRDKYAGILVFLMLAIFRNLCQGLIYGAPLRHTYAVFFPLFTFSVFVLTIAYFKNYNKKYLPIFLLAGFVLGYLTYCRISEGNIIKVSLAMFCLLFFIKRFVSVGLWFRKMSVAVFLIFALVFSGYYAFYGMISAFKYHRDKKCVLPPAGKRTFSKHPGFQMLYASLFRFSKPNGFTDLTNYAVVDKKYPELMKKCGGNLTVLTTLVEFNEVIRRTYFEWILHNPRSFLIYLGKSVYDYVLVLPYYSWSGKKSAHAYLPAVDESVEFEDNDLAMGFKDPPYNFKWLINLRWKYLPKKPLFWAYFAGAYFLLGQAVYTAIRKFKSLELPICLLQGMLIYFFFVSLIRILIPCHGQSAVVAFNVIAIYNLVRIFASKIES